MFLSSLVYRHLTSLNPYPSRYSTQAIRQPEGEPLMPCAITTPRVTGNQTSSETVQSNEQRNRLSFQQWLVAKK